MRLTALAILATLAIGCSNHANPMSPSVPGTVLRSGQLTDVAGTFVGTTKCDDDGHIGNLTAVFNEDHGEAMKADITWADSNGSATYHGHLQGKLDQLTIVATDLNGCNYKAAGVYTPELGTINGVYEAIGNCPKKVNTGTFSVTRQQ